MRNGPSVSRDQPGSTITVWRRRWHVRPRSIPPNRRKSKLSDKDDKHAALSAPDRSERSTGHHPSWRYRRRCAASPWHNRQPPSSAHQGSARYGKSVRNSLSFFSGLGGVFGSIGTLFHSRVVEQFDVIPFPIEVGAHIQERRQEAGRDLVLQAATEGPCAGRVHIDRIHVRDEYVDGAPQWYRQSLPVPRIVRHVELLKQDLADPREGLQDTGIGPMNRDRRIVVIKGAGES